MEERVENAQIKDTRIGLWGRLTLYWLDLEYDGAGQGFGGREVNADEIHAILKTVGVERWEDLVGKYVRVRRSDTKVRSIGHILKDKWFEPGGNDVQAE